jgi:hypothetical protein
MFSLLSATDEGLNMHVKGLPKWMSVKNIDHLSAKEKSRIVRARPRSVCAVTEQEAGISRPCDGVQPRRTPAAPRGSGFGQTAAARLWLRGAVALARICSSLGWAEQVAGALNMWSDVRSCTTRTRTCTQRSSSA